MIHYYFAISIINCPEINASKIFYNFAHLSRGTGGDSITPLCLSVRSSISTAVLTSILHLGALSIELFIELSIELSIELESRGNLTVQIVERRNCDP